MHVCTFDIGLRISDNDFQSIKIINRFPVDRISYSIDVLIASNNPAECTFKSTYNGFILMLVY